MDYDTRPRSLGLVVPNGGAPTLSPPDSRPTRPQSDYGRDYTADGSGTITTANVSQRVFIANPWRKWLLIQNNDTVNLWFKPGGPANAGAGSILLLPNQTYESDVFVFKEEIWVIGGTQAKTFTAYQAGERAP